MAETTSRVTPPPDRASARTRLLASVPPEVNTTRFGSAPASAATFSRADSAMLRAARPKPCTEAGLAGAAKAASKAPRASGRRDRKSGGEGKKGHERVDPG